MMKAWLKKDDSVASKRNLFGMMSVKSNNTDIKGDTFKDAAGKPPLFHC